MLHKIQLSAELFKEYLYAGIVLIFFIVYFAFSGSRPLTVPQAFSVLLSIGMLLLTVVTIYTIVHRLLRRQNLSFQIPYNIAYLIGLSLLISIVFFASLYSYYVVSHVQQGQAAMIIRGSQYIFFHLCSLYLIYLIFTFLWYVAGEKMLKIAKVKIAERLQIFASIGLGVYVMMLLYFILALMHQVDVGLPILLIALLYSLWKKRSWLQTVLLKKRVLTFSFPMQSGESMLHVLGICIVFLAPVLILRYVTYPSLSFDDWQTYLNIPLAILRHNGIASFIAPVNQINFAGSYVLLPFLQLYPASVSLISSYFFFLTIAIVGIIAVQRLKPQAALWACCILSTVLMNNFMLASIRPEAQMLFFSTLALALIFYSDRISQRFALAGFFLGIAVAMKLSALLFFPALCLLALMQPIRKAAAVRNVIISIFCALAAFAPWGIAMTVQNGSPLYPFIGAPSQSREPLTELRKEYFSELQSANYLTINIKQNLFQKIGISSLVTRSWPTDYLGPVLLLIAAAFMVKKTSRHAAQLLCAVIVSFAVWHFAHISWLHYLYFVFPLIALIYAEYLGQFRIQLIPYVVLALFAVAYVMTLFPGTLANATKVLAQDTSYLSQQQDNVGFQIASTINTLRDQDQNYVLFYIVGDEQYPYYPAIIDNERHVIMDNYVNPHDWFYYVTHTHTADELEALLKADGVTHIAIPKELPFAYQIRTTPEAYPTFSLMNERLEELRRSLPLVGEDRFIGIYQLELVMHGQGQPI